MQTSSIVVLCYMFLCMVAIAVVVYFITIGNKKTRAKKIKAAEEAYAAQKAEYQKIIDNARRAIAGAVLLQQSKFVGDKKTYDEIMNNTYNGPLPEKQENGSWSSPYPQLLALPIAGINYRSGIKQCVGPAKARLVSDPKNEFDPDAIKVIHESGTHVGFIPSDRTDDIRDIIPCYAMCDIEECTDEDDDNRHYFRGWLYINTNPSK